MMTTRRRAVRLVAPWVPQPRNALMFAILGIVLCVVPPPALAQSTTATIYGRVVDAQGLALPGVTVSVGSPNLQGTRTAVTTEHGDYILTLLPPGSYTITFDLTGFERRQETINLAPTQEAPIDVSLGVAPFTELIQVTGRAVDVLTETALVATNFSQELIAMLPTLRDINAPLLLAPSAHPTGPGGNWSIAGSMSFENLFLVNGVTVNENLRGQANDLYIPDAIQETTVATGGISAEYGRFGGGIVNVITKSGGNMFSGSYRQTLVNDDWRALVPKREGDPFANDTKVEDVVPTHEYTFGGPILRDQLWFFTAGRFQKRTEGRQLVQTNIPYTFTDDSKRYEVNATYSITSQHRIQGTFTRENRNQLNNTFNTASSMDERSLENREIPQDLTTVSYHGVLTPDFFVEGRVSRRNFTFIGTGAKSTDLIDGTLLLDRQRGNVRYWAATFCGVCTPDERDNQDVFLKANYFLSTSNAGSHNVVFGYDNFTEMLKANNRQSGSDYRVLGTTSIIRGTEIWPVFLGDGSTIIQWNPIPIPSEGSEFRTHAGFIHDTWRATGRLTANVGLRYDITRGTNQAGELVANDNLLSPRLGLIWDLTGSDEWSVTASFSRYSAAINNSIADSSSAAGNPQTWQYLYRGPDINPGGVPVVSTPDALRRLFDWFQTTGGCRPQDDRCRPNLPTNGAPTIPGVAIKIGQGLTTPNNWEYAAGINRQFGARAAVRADYIFRDFRDFYAERTDTTTGQVANEIGQRFDLTLVENSNIYTRKYYGLTAQGTYRFSPRTDIGVVYTVSRAWGNSDGETFAGGPLAGAALSYPEYKEARWNYPEGDVAIDQRHRARLWVNYGVPRLEGLTLSVLQTLESGVPYAGTTTSGVDPRPFVLNPGYVTPPSGTQTTYFFTDRDAFRTEGQRRTDFAANYQHGLNVSNRRIVLFAQAQVVNLFNQFQRCGCGGSVFVNGGHSQVRFIDQAVLTAVNTPARFRAFNPFTETPVQGVHWDYGPNFGKALSRSAYTTPRVFRVSFGVRF